MLRLCFVEVCCFYTWFVQGVLNYYYELIYILLGAFTASNERIISFNICIFSLPFNFLSDSFFWDTGITSRGLNFQNSELPMESRLFFVAATYEFSLAGYFWGLWADFSVPDENMVPYPASGNEKNKKWCPHFMQYHRPT